MVNLVIGKFISVMTNFTTTGSPPDNFMSEVSKYSYVRVYLCLAKNTTDTVVYQ